VSGRVRRWFDFQFMPQVALSAGFHLDLKGPFLDVHLPLGCLRLGWLWWDGTIGQMPSKWAEKRLHGREPWGSPQ